MDNRAMREGLCAKEPSAVSTDRGGAESAWGEIERYAHLTLGARVNKFFLYVIVLFGKCIRWLSFKNAQPTALRTRVPERLWPALYLLARNNRSLKKGKAL